MVSSDRVSLGTQRHALQICPRIELAEGLAGIGEQTCRFLAAVLCAEPAGEVRLCPGQPVSVAKVTKSFHR